MKTKTTYELTASGQIVKKAITESILVNPEEVLKALISKSQSEQNAETPKTPETDCFYNLGFGVSAFRKVINDHPVVWAAVHCPTLSFHTRWQLEQNADINNNKHFITPWCDDSEIEPFEIGAPLIWQVPEDLIVHFVVEYVDASTDLIQPSFDNLCAYPDAIPRAARNWYLTCFSRSRNTCVNMPLPNLYDDCHLCVGSAYEDSRYYCDKDHDGFVTSVLSAHKAWANTEWNTDLLGGATSIKSKAYQQLIRFDASNATQLEYTGCDTWEMATSNAPLGDIYKPYISTEPATQTIDPIELEA